MNKTKHFLGYHNTNKNKIRTNGQLKKIGEKAAIIERKPIGIYLVWNELSNGILGARIGAHKGVPNLNK